jgi:exopolyphosphatase/guanosine-5'-triphosphate,3'-diphosphate pyrophosphatase
MAHRVAGDPASPESRRLAVIDMGSNTFRLVVFRYRPGGPFQLVDEIREVVRLSARAGRTGLSGEAITRAGRASRLYAAFCRSAGLEDVVAVATSAVRDAANQTQVLKALTAGGELPVRVLSEGEEAWYGYLGAVNSTTLRDGHVLDVGGGSLQVAKVVGRELDTAVSRPLGAVRMTERFLPGATASRSGKKGLRAHVTEQLAKMSSLGRHEGRLVGIGGTIRTLAAMALKASGNPISDPHGTVITAGELEELIKRMAAVPVAERASIPGLKQDRADITLAGAITVAAVMERAGADRLEVCSQGLREGVFYERFLAPADPPLVTDVRRHSVRNVAATYDYDRPHAEHVATLALGLYDELAALGLQQGDPLERELLWAAAILHDVGVQVDYNDHHKHSYYLVLNAGLPGYDHRELAMIALLVRAHRKGPPTPTLDGLDALLTKNDPARLGRLAACLRIAEQLERGRARGIRDLRVEALDGRARLVVHADGDPAVALWSAEQERPAFERAFGRRLEVAAEA